MREHRAGFSLKARGRSFRYAWAGFQVLLRSQHNAWIHAAATFAVMLAGLAFRLRPVEWGVLILAVGMVWAMEALNTAIELLADEVSTEQRPLIGKAKDVAAFGVLAAAVTAVVIGLTLFLPRIFQRFPDVF